MRGDQKLVADIRTLIAPADPAGAYLDAGMPAAICVAEPSGIMTAPRVTKLRPWRQPRRLRLAIAGAAAVAVIVAAGAVAVAHRHAAAAPPVEATPPMLRYVLAGHKDPAASSTLPPAERDLEQLASIAARQPQPQRPHGARIGYVVTEEWGFGVTIADGTSVAVLYPERNQTWTWPGGYAKQKATYGKPQDLSRAGEPAPLVSAAVQGMSGTNTQTYPTTEEFGPLVSGLSVQPGRLETELKGGPDPQAGPYKGSREPLSYYLIDEITALQHQVVSPKLESALWQVLATRSDIQYMGLVTDRAGRRGEAFCTDASGERLVLIISPTTGLLLGEEDLDLTNPGGLTIPTFPAVIGYVTFLSQSYVARVGK